MLLDVPATRLQRLLGGAVASLLAANALALPLVLVSDGTGNRRPHRMAPPSAAVAVSEPRTVAVITTKDGRRLLADPTTPEGRKAIADATAGGGSVQNLSLPVLDGKTKFTIPGKSGAVDLGALVRGLGGGGTTSGGGSTANGGSTTSTTAPAGGVIQIHTGTPLDAILNDAIRTGTSTVSSIAGTASSVVAPAISTVTSLLPVTATTTLLGTVTSTVTSVVQQGSSTATTVPVTAPPTTAPATTLPPTTTTSVCLVVPNC